ncbi:hypothetical protein S40288_10876 [Stachybotrys chartarum IBT 40288]|nr:hypothetical protein S40288_10876 [Stachybotrys chartarum IBT 40288]
MMGVDLVDEASDRLGEWWRSALRGLAHGCFMDSHAASSIASLPTASENAQLSWSFPGERIRKREERPEPNALLLGCLSIEEIGLRSDGGYLPQQKLPAIHKLVSRPTEPPESSKIPSMGTEAKTSKMPSTGADAKTSKMPSMGTETKISVMWLFGECQGPSKVASGGTHRSNMILVEEQVFPGHQRIKTAIRSNFDHEELNDVSPSDVRDVE